VLEFIVSSFFSSFRSFS